MTLFVTVKTGEMAQVLASRTGYVGGMDADGWGGVFPSLFLTTVFLFLLLSFLGGGLISRILGQRGLEFGHGSMSGTITLWAPLIHLLENRKRDETPNLKFSPTASTGSLI